MQFFGGFFLQGVQLNGMNIGGPYVK